MPVASTKTRLGSRGKPEQTRAAILQAAVREFADAGISGARTDAIAKAAGVNKALLYYYFQDKETLYGAALDHSLSQLSGHMMEVLHRNLPAGEMIKTYVGIYFDFIASHAHYRNLMQREMLRAAHGSPHMPRLAKRYFHPLAEKLGEVLRAGIASGEFRKIDPAHFIPSMVALVIFYFASAPVTKAVSGVDPLSPEKLAERRAAVLDFISAALFRNHENQGARK
jgi:TetR/AcrR family transcriptional regulator